MKRARSIAGCAVVACVLGAACGPGAVPAARADELPNPRVRVEITGLTPPVAGIEVTVLRSPLAHLAPQLELRNTTRDELLLFGAESEPFLRIGPAGVFGNGRSRTFAASIDPRGGRPPSPGGPEPSWTKLSASASWRWYEARAGFFGPVPALVQTSRSTAVLKQWSVPGRYRKAGFSIDGRVVFVPRLGRVTARIVSVVPADPGVTFTLVQGPVPAVQIAILSTAVVSIAGRDGAPFLRAGPDGIEANENSATYRDTKGLEPARGAAPRFVKVAAGREYAWLERRAAFLGDPPERVQQAGVKAVLSRWSITGSIGDRPLSIDGVTEWIPLAARARAAPAGGTGWLPIAGGVAVAVLALGALGVVARRRRTAGR